MTSDEVLDRFLHIHDTYKVSKTPGCGLSIFRFWETLRKLELR